MKVKLDVSPELRDAVAAELTSRGIELDEDAPYVLTERGRFAEALTLRDAGTNARVIVRAGELITLEAFGHSVEARSANLAYNESAAAEGRPLIERPLKREGVNYLGTALGIADAVALIGVVAWGHRALERRRARRAGSDGGFGGGSPEGSGN